LLLAAQTGLNNQLNDKPHLAKMGTTFTGLFFSKHACFAAHIGDSRIYLVRPSERKIWHTWDHSLVGELVKNKDITREAGRHHPMGNRISKAMIANEKGKTVKADILKLDQLQKGDLFLLCSDGVNEAWSEHDLVELLCNSSLSLEQKTTIIKNKCKELSNDNNTAYLLEIEELDVLNFGNNEEVKWIPIQSFYDDFELYKKKQAEEAAEEEVEEEVEAIIIETPNQSKVENNLNPSTPESPSTLTTNNIAINRPQNNVISSNHNQGYTSHTKRPNLLQNKFMWFIVAVIAAIIMFFILPGEGDDNESKLNKTKNNKNSVIIDNTGQNKINQQKKDLKKQQNQNDSKVKAQESKGGKSGLDIPEQNKIKNPGIKKKE
jgi:protein phosphatase